MTAAQLAEAFRSMAADASTRWSAFDYEDERIISIVCERIADKLDDCHDVEEST